MKNPLESFERISFSFEYKYTYNIKDTIIMMIEEIKTQVREIVEQHPRAWTRIIKSPKCAELYAAILAHTSHIKDMHFSARTYWFLTNRTEYPTCPTCGKDLDHDMKCTPLGGYESKHCSIICSQKDPAYQEEKKRRSLEKYGTEHPAQSDEVRTKIKTSWAARTDEEIKESSKQREQTCLATYGYKFVSQVPEIKAKATAKFISRTKDEKQKSREKTVKTLIKNYGKDYKTVIFKNFHNIAQIKNSYRLLAANQNFILLCTEEEFIQMRLNKVTDFPVQCRKCGEKYIYRLGQSRDRNHCPKCKDLDGTSYKEKSLGEFVKLVCDTLGLVCYFNTRSVIGPQELDIYIPGKKLAIEFDGLYWHSDLEKHDYKYHLKKTEACLRNGIQLIHVFENEWDLKPDIVKSRIKNLLGMYETTVFARKCQVKELSNADSKQFQAQNHIQGPVNSGVSLGLFYGNDLVSLMTFGRCRFDKQHEWELLRFCNKLGYHVPGAAGKLLKHFEQNWKPKSLVSYADRRWSVGKLYEALGFAFVHSSAPNYWYFQNNSMLLESRLKYQKHKLLEMFDDVDESMTEVEIMRKHGYNRIYDCGNMVFEKMFPK